MEPSQPLDKPLSKTEKMVCELTWGGVPTDVAFVRNSNLFKENLKKLEQLEEFVQGKTDHIL